MRTRFTPHGIESWRLAFCCKCDHPSGHVHLQLWDDKDNRPIGEVIALASNSVTAKSAFDEPKGRQGRLITLQQRRKTQSTRTNRNRGPGNIPARAFPQSVLFGEPPAQFSIRP
jgi:hypothetical protein